MDMMKEQRILHVVINDFKPDYRVLKEVVTLRAAGADVEVYALLGRGQEAREIIDGVKVRRFRLWTRGLPARPFAWPLKYLECVGRMSLASLSSNVAVVHGHDILGLIPAAIIKGLRRSRLVYDSHELWSDSNHKAANPAWLTFLIQSFERLFARRADAVITVSESIADEMQRGLGIEKPRVIRNVPEARAREGGGGLRERLGIPASACVFLYVGAILPNRGIDTLFEAFSKLDGGAHLVLLGTERLPDWAASYVDRCGGRIHVVPPVPPRLVPVLASAADVGLVPIRGVNKNHQFCLPNKLFEYVQAHLAVIASDMPEMRRLIAERQIGLTFEDGNSESAAEAMRTVLADPLVLQAMKEASARASRELTWEREGMKLLALYEGLFVADAPRVARHPRPAEGG
jgi:glycosyltransferase involved in cell wall biosynthesis